MQADAKGGPKEVIVYAVVHRAATGKDENLGPISYYHRNPFKRLWFYIRLKYRKCKRLDNSTWQP